MKLPDALKHAVETADWFVVCSVYTQLTGLPLEPPKPKEPDYLNMEIDIPIGDGRVAHIVGKSIDVGHPVVSVPSEDIVKANREMFLTAPEADDEEIEELVKNIDDNRGQGEPLYEEAEAPDPDHDFLAPTKQKGVDPLSGGGADPEHNYGSKERMIVGQQRENRFQDDGKILQHVKGIGPPPKPRTKKNKTGLLTVQCKRCKRFSDVSPMLARGYDRDDEQNRWHCNDCLTGRGSTRE